VIRVTAINDSVPEGIETLVATISNCPPPGLLPPCYDFEIDPAHESATVFIRDDAITQASLVITRPSDGASFQPGETILIEATAIEIIAERIDPDGLIRKVEFFADDRKIGERNVEFVPPPEAGRTQTFDFVWRFPTPGPHVLTARATDDDAATAGSAPIEIRVT